MMNNQSSNSSQPQDNYWELYIFFCRPPCLVRAQDELHNHFLQFDAVRNSRLRHASSCFNNFIRKIATEVGQKLLRKKNLTRLFSTEGFGFACFGSGSGVKVGGASVLPLTHQIAET
jgi:hypothetical protein